MAEIAAETGTWGRFLIYGWMARQCVKNRNTKWLAEARNRIRAVQPKPEAVHFEWKIDVLLEQHRIDALAQAGLPDEAAALYEFCWSTGISYLDRPSGLFEIARAYVLAGKRDAAKTFLRKHFPHIKDDVKYLVAPSAAYAGDYDLVDEAMAGTSPQEFIYKVRPVILAAHRMGDAKHRDVLLDRYRKALAARPPDEKIGLPFELPCDVATVEAALGRYDAALALLPKLQGEHACDVRVLLIDLILREQGKISRGFPAAWIYLDDRE